MPDSKLPDLPLFSAIYAKNPEPVLRITFTGYWKPQPRAKPDGRGEGNEAQAAHQEDMPARNRQPVALSYFP